MKEHPYPIEWEVKGLERGLKILEQERDKLEKELDRVNGQIQGYLKSLNALKQET